jgi:hypothetical protein
MNKLKKQAKNLSKNIKILKTVSIVFLLLKILGLYYTKKRPMHSHCNLIKDKKNKSDKAYRSSSSFFKQLQENTQIKSKKPAKAKSGDSNENKKNAKKLKL